MPTKQEVGAVGGAEEERYLAREAGWGVRRMGRVGEEMRRVALVQAEAFHVPVALFNDFFFDFFKVCITSNAFICTRNVRILTKMAFLVLAKIRQRCWRRSFTN